MFQFMFSMLLDISKVLFIIASKTYQSKSNCQAMTRINLLKSVSGDCIFVRTTITHYIPLPWSRLSIESLMWQLLLTCPSLIWLLVLNIMSVSPSSHHLPLDHSDGHDILARVYNKVVLLAGCWRTWRTSRSTTWHARSTSCWSTPWPGRSARSARLPSFLGRWSAEPGWSPWSAWSTTHQPRTADGSEGSEGREGSNVHEGWEATVCHGGKIEAQQFSVSC